MSVQTPMTSLQQRLERGDVIILDGGTGTERQRRGVPMHSVAWGAAAMATHSEIVRAIHEDYLRAGAEILITNSLERRGTYLLPPDWEIGLRSSIATRSNLPEKLATASPPIVRCGLPARSRASCPRAITANGRLGKPSIPVAKNPASQTGRKSQNLRRPTNPFDRASALWCLSTRPRWHANKRGVRYRYYVSQALLQNRKAEAGTISRVAAPDVEELILAAVRHHITACGARTRLSRFD